MLGTIYLGHTQSEGGGVVQMHMFVYLGEGEVYPCMYARKNILQLQKQKTPESLTRIQTLPDLFYLKNCKEMRYMNNLRD